MGIKQTPIPSSFYDKDFWDGKKTHWWIEGVDEKAKRKTEGRNPFNVAKYFGVNSCVLDVGCGIGWLVLFLNELEVDAWGLDYSEYAIKNSVIPKKVILGDMTNLPFENNSFDLLISRENFEHLTIEQADKAFAEMIRVTKKWIYMTIWINHDKKASDEAVLDDLKNDPTHISYATRKFWLNKFQKYVDYGTIVRNEELEKSMDWLDKKRCFVYEKIK